MAQMTTEVPKLLERALLLSVEVQEALADSLISNLGGQVDEGVMAAWESEIGKRVAELDSGQAKTTSWGEVRKPNLLGFGSFVATAIGGWRTISGD